MTDLLIKNGALLLMDGQETIYNPGWLSISGPRIEAVGAGEPPAEIENQAGRIIEARGMAVLPGLVNGHTHLSQTFMRGLADDRPLLAWLKQVMWPTQAAMTPEDMWLASLLGLVENLRCGVTGLVQHHKVTTSAEHAEAVLEATRTVGLRLRLARGWVDLGDSREAPEAIIEATRHLYEQWHQSEGGRITVGFGPMAAWRCSDETMRRTVDLARQWGLPVHIHVAEARAEMELMQQRNGLGHIEWLASLDALGPETQLVHCVWLNETELDLIAAAGATVIHCPVSNMYLASGIAPVRQMLDRAIPVALGTDGSASHNSQDLLETLKVAALLTKVSSGEAMAMLPMDGLRMVTTNGARLLGSDYTGQLRAGARADISLIRLNTVRAMPVHRPESAVVYNANGPDAHTVLVDGQILLDGGRVTMLDEASLLTECQKTADRLLMRAGVRP